MTGPINVWLTAPAIPNVAPCGNTLPVPVVVSMFVDVTNGATTPAWRVLVQSDSYVTIGLVELFVVPVSDPDTAPAGVENPITAQTPAARARAAPPEATLFNLVSLKRVSPSTG
jgi:hypothetical protein